MEALAAYLQNILVASLYAVVLFLGLFASIYAIVFVFLAKWSFRRASNYFVPAFFAFDLISRLFFKFALIATVGLVAASRGIPKGNIEFPASGSLQRLWGERMFGLWWLMFLGYVLLAVGFPPLLDPETHVRTRRRFIAMAVLLGVGLMFWPGHFVIGTAISSIAFIGFTLDFSWRVARQGYKAALPACAAPDLSLDAERDLAFLHLTDAHLTASPASPRVEAEPPGNMRLDRLPGALSGRHLDWLFSTGDMADHGRSEEWTAAVIGLKNLQAANGCRVVLAPGNHDLGIAYNSEDSLFAQLLAKQLNRAIPHVDGLYLRRYFESAAALEPGLHIRDGRLLRDLLAPEPESFADLMSCWEAAFHSSDPDSLGAVSKKGQALYPEWSAEEWDGMAGGTRPKTFEELGRGEAWRRRWMSWFPLHVIDAEQGSLVVVLNSVSPNTTLMGGAWGDLGGEQLDALSELVRSQSPRTTYVLCHHAPLRWEDDRVPERFAFQTNRDWATLSIAPEYVTRLSEALKSIAARGGAVVFLCGHRHGGPGHRPRTMKSSGVIFAEGASFADAGTRMLAGKNLGTGELQVGSVAGPLA